MGNYCGVPPPVFASFAGAARDDARRYGPGEGGFRGRVRTRGTGGIRPCRAALRPWLCARNLSVAGDQQARGRIWRFDGEPVALSAGGLRCLPCRVAREPADVGAYFGDRLDRWRHHRRRRRRVRDGVQGAWLRPDQRVDRPDRRGGKADIRPYVPGAVFRTDPGGGGDSDAGCWQHLRLGSGQHDRRRRPVRSGRAGADPSLQSLLHPTGGGLLRGRGHRLARSVHVGQVCGIPPV